mmetsp:Transcript_46680/g.111014  ORF Transcript_46680/g.111014 Transcript_46680/m.111014 type:complete len:209 (-) Transcript_46680:2014-2640(-)
MTGVATTAVCSWALATGTSRGEVACAESNVGSPACCAKVPFGTDAWRPFGLCTSGQVVATRVFGDICNPKALDDDCLAAAIFRDSVAGLRPLVDARCRTCSGVELLSILSSTCTWSVGWLARVPSTCLVMMIFFWDPHADTGDKGVRGAPQADTGVRGVRGALSPQIAVRFIGDGGAVYAVGFDALLASAMTGIFPTGDATKEPPPPA